MENWDEVRTALFVAQHGTVSGAATELGVHHATVIRHIDALEARLGAKLFQRHARGYTATEAGQDLMQVAQTTNEQMAQLANRLRGRGNEVAGELLVTSLVGLSPLLTPALARFREMHPRLTIRLLTSDRVFRLEYGEAHVAIRAGRKPDQLDNVVQPFLPQNVALYASNSYVSRKGLLKGEEDLPNHEFVTIDNLDSRTPFFRWLFERVPNSASVFRVSETGAMIEAIRAGAGMGFMPVWRAKNLPDLVQVLAPREEWSASMWLVTHVDLHRTAKVQAFLKFLKEDSQNWA